MGNADGGGVHQGAHVRALAVTVNDMGRMHVKRSDAIGLSF